LGRPILDTAVRMERSRAMVGLPGQSVKEVERCPKMVLAKILRPAG
jgi:hypothetical protein